MGQPKVEIVDEHAIKYSWDKPNPYFIESQARAAPLFLFRPCLLYTSPSPRDS